MTNTVLINALESGLARGESLEKVTESLLNAGYLKKDIEEAAKELKKIPVQEKPVIEQKVETGQKQTSPIIWHKKFRKKMVTILIWVSLFILFNLVIAIFLFKEELIHFFNKIFN